YSWPATTPATAPDRRSIRTAGAWRSTTPFRSRSRCPGGRGRGPPRGALDGRVQVLDQLRVELQPPGKEGEIAALGGAVGIDGHQRGAVDLGGALRRGRAGDHRVHVERLRQLVRDERPLRLRQFQLA